jgi:hypothetical protein
MSPTVVFLADVLVAVLLAATIGTSIVLSRRIARLKADETAMRKTVGELMIATESAERAIAGLRAALGDCDRTLVGRLREAERYAADLGAQVAAGETVMNRIAQIVETTRQVPEAERVREHPVDRLGAAAAAAQALAERAARRVGGRTS